MMKKTIQRAAISLLVLAICAMFSVAILPAASAADTIVKAEASVNQLKIGDTLTINIKILNAQDLFGLDVTLSWNNQVLQLQSASNQLGVESHPNGVLHESADYPIEVVSDEASQDTGLYHLSATSTGASTPTFNGNGNIATLSFKVAAAGATGLALEDVEVSQLLEDETAVLVEPSTSVDSLSAAVPEFPVTAIVVAAVIAVKATLLVTTKVMKSKKP